MDPLTHDIQKFKEECLANQNYMLKVLESLHRNQESMNGLLSKAFKVEHPCAQKQHDVLASGPQNSMNSVGEAHGVSQAGSQPTESHLVSQIDCEKSTAALHELWHLFEGSIGQADASNLYESIMERNENKRTMTHNCLIAIFGQACLTKEEPNTTLARMVSSTVFTCVSICFILLNTGVMAYETDFAIQDMLKAEKDGLSDWMIITNRTFNIVFSIELAVRMVALRSWFFISPDWAWNLLDVWVVAISLVFEIMNSVDLTFLRSFRILRSLRIFRIFRLLRFFRELRRMLLSILACLKTLAWGFLFFSFIIFMFCLMFLQGLAQGLAAMPANSLELSVAQDEVRKYYSDLPDAMLSLFAAATGGVDWMNVRAPLTHAGALYTTTFLLYIVFVTVGVLNVLTGIFVSSADEISDVNLAVQNECLRIEGDVDAMMELFQDMDESQLGRLDWVAFDQCMQNHTIQAYLSCHGLNASHSRLLFQLLADPVTETVGIQQFVLGVLKLKGEAKAFDTRILRRMVGVLRPILTQTVESQIAILRRSLIQPSHHGEPSESNVPQDMQSI